ncbi:MAG: DUF664 domain-containing protein, partial [Acidimicrobiales bacterium]
MSYLNYFRERVIEKMVALPEHTLACSILPSGWTPLELLKHLTFVEMRWLEWGFEGTAVDNPWGDRRGDRWQLSKGDSRTSLIADSRMRGVRSEAIVRSHSLDDHGKPGPRWNDKQPPALERVLFHLLQEYARHSG